MIRHLRSQSRLAREALRPFPFHEADATFTLMRSPDRMAWYYNSFVKEKQVNRRARLREFIVLGDLIADLTSITFPR